MAVAISVPSTLFFTSSDVEVLVIELIFSSSYYLCLAYIPPNCSSSYLEHFISTLSILPPNSNLILLGDFNMVGVNWDSFTTTPSSLTSLCETLVPLNLTQLVHSPTHRKGNSLDLVFTNVCDKISDLPIDSSACSLMSDHYLISFCLNSQSHLPTHLRAFKHTLFKYSKANLDYLYSFLDSCSSWLLSCHNANTAWLQLKSDILSACDYAVPTITVSSHRSPAWFNSSLKHLLNKIHTLRSQIKSKPSPSSSLLTKLSQLESTFKTQIQLLGSECTCAYKHKSIHPLIDQFSSSPGKLYSHLKSLRRSSNCIPHYTREKKFL